MKSQPQATRDISSTDFKLLPIATTSNKTDFQSNSDEESHVAFPVVPAVVSAIVIAVVFLFITILVLKKSRSTGNWSVRSRSESKNTTGSETPKPCQGSEAATQEPLTMPIQGPRPSESANTVRYSYDSDHSPVARTLQLESTASPPFQEQSLDLASPPDQHNLTQAVSPYLSSRPATLASICTHQPVEKSTDSVNPEEDRSFSHLDHDCHQLHVEDIVHPFSTNILEETVGPEGGNFGIVTVPKHAVRRQQRIRYRLLFGLEPTDIPNDWFVFSPTIVLEPDDVPFQVPVKVRFPFTATLEGWTLVLMRESENPEKKRETVLTIDTDDRRVIRHHSHCSFDLNKRLLLLEHFCKYRWCGYKKEDASSAEKRLACLLYARLDSSGNSYEFALYLTDDCDDIFQEAEKLAEDISGMSLGLRDKEKIIIGTDGDLTIEIIGEGLQIDMYNGKNSVVIQLRDLFKRCEIHKRILFEGKCAHHGDGSKDSQLRICLSTSKRSEIMRATFNSKSRELQRCHSFRSLAGWLDFKSLCFLCCTL
jgi:hypothetical protein